MPFGRAALFTLSCLLPALGADASSVPLEPFGRGLWTVAVSAGPSAPTWRFLVDTGASRTVLDATAARRGGIPVAPGARLVTPAGTVDAGLATLAELRLNGRVRTALRVVVVDLSALGRPPVLDGILGMDVLDGDHVVFDFAHGRLGFPAAAEAAALSAGTPVPIREVGGRLIVEARVNGAARDLVLDSGAEVAVIYDAGAGGGTRLATAGGPARGRSVETLVALGRLPLGLMRALLVAAPAGRTGAAGVLPAARFTWIHLDRTAGVVRLVPRPTAPGRG
ncbi:MAG: retropepsin-like aspartic protease [Vicinamibacterales bacterium]